MNDRIQRAATSKRPPRGPTARRLPPIRGRSGGGAIALALLLGLVGVADLRAQVPLSLADPDLTRRVQDLVVRHSPELDAGRASVQAASSRAAGAGFAPPLVLSGEMDDVPDGFDVTDAGFRLELGREFLTGGRSAAARVVAATHTARRLAGEDSLLVSAEASLRDRFSVGDARYVDVLRLRTERLRIQTDRAEALAGARAEREALIGLAGPDGSGPAQALVDSAAARAPRGDEAAEIPPPPALDSLLGLAGEILVAEAALEQATAARELAVAARRPRLSAASPHLRAPRGGGGVPRRRRARGAVRRLGRGTGGDRRGVHAEVRARQG